jgi:sarcosine oxidase, subunit gamma
VTAELHHAGYPAQLGLRVEPGSAAAARVEELLGGPLPGPNTVRGDVLWLGPDEWLIVGRELGEAELCEALAGQGAAVELSANRVALLLTGPSAREVLAGCCTLDLDERSFPPGRCAQTLLAKAPVVVERQPGGFRLLVRPSFAAYVTAWLEDAVAGLGH